MSVRIEWDGLDEFRYALRQLPDALATEAGFIVTANAAAAAAAIQAGYPQGPTGHLKRGVSLQSTRSAVATSAIVRSRAPHAWIFEHGTGNRRTNAGANRGRMPQPAASARMIPHVVHQRRIMMERLIALVRSAGFEVHDDAA